MSRDWTPQELHRADVVIFGKEGHHLYESTFEWVSADGTRTPYIHKDYQYRDMFPSLSFLGEGIAYSLIETLRMDRRFVQEIEDTLTSIREQDIPEKRVSERDFKDEPASIVYEWYRGLSTGSVCYDRSYNNEAFKEKISGYYNKRVADNSLFFEGMGCLNEFYWRNELAGYSLTLTDEQKRILFERIPADAKPVSCYGKVMEDGDVTFSLDYQDGEIVPCVNMRIGDNHYPYYEHGEELLKPDERELLIGRVRAYEYKNDCYDSIDEIR